MSMCCDSITCPPLQFPVGLCGMCINELDTPTICDAEQNKWPHPQCASRLVMKCDQIDV